MVLRMHSKKFQTVSGFEKEHLDDTKAANLLSLAGMGTSREMFKLMLNTFPVNPNSQVDHAFARDMCVVQSLAKAGKFKNLKTVLHQPYVTTDPSDLAKETEMIRLHLQCRGQIKE